MGAGMSDLFVPKGPGTTRPERNAGIAAAPIDFRAEIAKSLMVHAEYYRMAADDVELAAAMLVNRQQEEHSGFAQVALKEAAEELRRKSQDWAIVAARIKDGQTEVTLRHRKVG